MPTKKLKQYLKTFKKKAPSKDNLAGKISQILKE